MAATILGQFIRRTRRQQHLSLNDVAQRVQITPTFLSEIERGSRNASAELLERLASALSVDLVQLEDLDSWAALGDFREMVAADQELSSAFTRVIREIKQGRQAVGDLTRCLERMTRRKSTAQR